MRQQEQKPRENKNEKGERLSWNRNTRRAAESERERESLPKRRVTPETKEKNV